MFLVVQTYKVVRSILTVDEEQEDLVAFREGREIFPLGLTQFLLHPLGSRPSSQSVSERCLVVVTLIRVSSGRRTTSLFGATKTSVSTGSSCLGGV